jgi:hypothetical protein
MRSLGLNVDLDSIDSGEEGDEPTAIAAE